MLKSVKLIINLVFDKFYVFLIFVYVFMLLGIYTKYLFKLPNFNYGILLLIFIPTIYNWTIYSLEKMDLKKIDNDKQLNEQEKQIKSSKVDAKYMDSKLIKSIRFLLIIIISFSIGCLIYQNNPITMHQFIHTLLFGFFMSFFLGYTVLYEANNRKRARNFFNAKSLLPIFGIIPALFIFIFKDIINIFSELSNYDYSMFALTFALLCATLSILSFTYSMTLDPKETIRQNMIKSGKYFFISTIHCLIFLSCLFVLILIWNKTNISTLENINIMDSNYFLIANISVILIFSFFASFIYSMKYLSKGIYLSLKNLPFNYELI